VKNANHDLHTSTDVLVNQAFFGELEYRKDYLLPMILVALAITLATVGLLWSNGPTHN